MKDKYVLGLDIGIASVGWAVLDRNTHEIAESGVSLFQDGRRKTNAERRAFRSGKRIARRRKVRLEDARRFLNGLGYYEDNSKTNPYSLRVKGLNEKLTKSEFYIAYMHLVKHRGSSFETVDTDVNEDDERSAKSNLQINERLIKEGKYPCEIQMMKFEETGKIRGFDNVFKTKHYVLELKQILKNQDFNAYQEEKLIHFIERRRSFEEGPGSLKSPSKYGRFIKLNDGSIQEINLIEKMRGHCSVYPEELRAPKNSFSAEMFNFLNDLNNLTIFQDNTEYKLSSSQKEDIIDMLIYSNKLPGATPKQLAKFIDVPLETISGFRIDTKERPLLSEFKGTRSILKALGDSFVLIGNEDTFDLISEILTQTKVLESRVEKLTAQFEEKLSKKQIESLSQLTGISQYHNLSLKIMKELREHQILEAKNHMKLLSERSLLKNDLDQYVGKKNIQFDDSLIFNPIVKRSIRQSFKIINAIRKKYGELDAIIIEMPRDNSPEDEKKRIRDTQKQNELLNKQVLDVAKKAVGGLLTDKQLKGKARMKVRLYMQQDGKCLYSGEPLSLNDIVRGTDSYEIDHVIPISVSFDDSFNNKVLVTHLANQEKGQKTPYQAFNENKIKGWGYKGYYSHIFDLLQRKLINSRKFSVLTYSEPIDKYENLEKFIARNLVDTRYSSRVVLNTLQSYYKANNLNTSILTIKGAVTNQFRKKVDLPKDRDESYEHHAIDAAIIALMSEKEAFYKILKSKEKLDFNLEENYYDSDTLMYISKLRRLNNIKISHKVDKKPNRTIADQTIYSTRTDNAGNEWIIKKRKDIYGDDGVKVAQDFLSNKGANYLIANHDPKTHELLLSIVENYAKDFGITSPKKLKDNPFKDYTDKNGPIRKFSKKNNGPIITSLKYRDSRLGNHLDITDNFTENEKTAKDKRVVLLQISPYRTDFYKDSNNNYHFVTIRYAHIKYSEITGKHYIEEDKYNELLKGKNIPADAKFMFSFHRDEYIRIVRTTKGEIEDKTWRFIATNNDINRVIEVKTIQKRDIIPQVMLSIGKSIHNIEKYHVDILGNRYLVNKEALKLEF